MKLTVKEDNSRKQKYLIKLNIILHIWVLDRWKDRRVNFIFFLFMWISTYKSSFFFKLSLSLKHSRDSPRLSSCVKSGSGHYHPKLSDHFQWWVAGIILLNPAWILCSWCRTGSGYLTWSDGEDKRARSTREAQDLVHCRQKIIHPECWMLRVWGETWHTVPFMASAACMSSVTELATRLE